VAEYNLKVNGKSVTIVADPGTTLSQALREKLALTGTKEGCGKGECGACTVLLNGEAVNSCLVILEQAHGQEVITIEGLAPPGELHPLQQAFIETGAVQCGYCTPGMILSAKALLDQNPHPTRAEIRRGLSGNICRCTGYQKIVDAVELAASGKIDLAGRAD